MQTTQSLPRIRPLNLSTRSASPAKRIAVASCAVATTKPARVQTLAEAIGRAQLDRFAPAQPVVRAQPQALEGRAFAAKRLGYVLELVGSCMMIAAFLALALFV